MSDVAFWSALGATIGGGVIAFIIELLRWFFGRPRVKVKVSRAIWPDPVSKIAIEGVSLQAINKRDKTVTLSGVGFTFKGKRAPSIIIPVPIPQPLPYELGGRKSLTELISLENLLPSLREAQKRANELEWAWFRSQSDDLYREKLHKDLIQWLEKAYRESVEANK